MIWLVWRRQRAALLLAIGLAALVAVVTGIGRYVAVGIGRDLGVLPCLRGVLTGVCGTPNWYGYVTGLNTAVNSTWISLLLLPAVAGIIAGAGLFGRELERGTHVFALSQSTPRLRWWATGLLVAGLPVAAAVAVAGVVANLALRPFGNMVLRSPLDTQYFLTSGVLPAVYTLLAFGAAAAAGLVLRNALAAIAVAAVAYLVVTFVLGFTARDRYLPPETAIVPFTGGWFPVPADARSLGYGYLDRQGREIDPQVISLPPCPDVTTTEEYGDCLRSAGFVEQFVRYQPASRYWPFQAIESGIVLALVAGTLGAGLWGLRRRVH